jgi:hypothetical protein
MLVRRGDLLATPFSSRTMFLISVRAREGT